MRGSRNALDIFAVLLACGALLPALLVVLPFRRRRGRGGPVGKNGGSADAVRCWRLGSRRYFVQKPKCLTFELQCLTLSNSDTDAFRKVGETPETLCQRADSLSHSCGDELAQAIGELLRSSWCCRCGSPAPGQGLRRSETSSSRGIVAERPCCRCGRLSYAPCRLYACGMLQALLVACSGHQIPPGRSKAPCSSQCRVRRCLARHAVACLQAGLPAHG
ncbi:hypothetical protein ACVWYI_004456 [Bradyrhizobium sp. LB13.1]